MGFNIKHISKYFRWLKKDREAYRDACLVSKELAGINRRLNVALLMGKNEKAEGVSIEKHRWLLNYLQEKCPETLNRYRGMEAP